MDRITSIEVYQFGTTIGLDDLSWVTGFHRDLIRELERAGILDSTARDWRGDPVFESGVVSRCRMVDRMHRCENMSFHFIRRWIWMVDRLERAERQLEAYQSIREREMLEREAPSR